MALPCDRNVRSSVLRMYKKRQWRRRSRTWFHLDLVNYRASGRRPTAALDEGGAIVKYSKPRTERVQIIAQLVEELSIVVQIPTTGTEFD